MLSELTGPLDAFDALGGMVHAVDTVCVPIDSDGGVRGQRHQFAVLFETEREFEAEHGARIGGEGRKALQQLHHRTVRRFVIHLGTILAEGGHQHHTCAENLSADDGFADRLLGSGWFDQRRASRHDAAH